MTREELADTVLLQIECFWVLQEITEALAQGNSDAARLFEAIYQQRPSVDWRQLPLVQIRTTLAMMILPICFIFRLSNEELAHYGFTLRPEFELDYSERGQAKSASPDRVLRTIRNAIVHLPDFAAGSGRANVAFEPGALRLWSRRDDSQVVFRSPDGFIRFLGELFRIARSHAVTLTCPT